MIPTPLPPPDHGSMPPTRHPGHLPRLAAGVFLVATLLASGCAAKRTPAGATTPAIAAEEATPARVHTLWEARTQNGAPRAFCIGPGDLLEINVFHWPEMTGLRTRVSTSGFISLPMLGEIQTAGLTESQLQERIAERLRAGIMRDPNVSVFVTEYASQQVSVTGAVSRPGLISLTRDRRTVAELISEAGGLSEHAGGKILFFPARSKGCDEQNAPLRLASTQPPADITPVEIDTNAEYASARSNPLGLPVVGGDAIVVNRGRYFVDGWVVNPGAFDISPGVTAFGALTAAGGALFAGDLSNVVIWRSERGGTKKRIDVDMRAISKGAAKDVTLESGDVVSIPASTVRLIPYSGYWIMTNIIRVGAGVSLTGI